MKPRLGLVGYLNARPIGWGLARGRQRGRFDLVERTPAVLADELALGRLDLALLPVIEYARAEAAGREMSIVPGIAIAADGPAESVLLFSRVPPERAQRIAVDASSRTSVALLRLLLRRRLRPGKAGPEFVPHPPDLPAMLDACDAALMIGDAALFAHRRHAGLVSRLAVLDLGAEWRMLTGLPFVFAFWAGWGARARAGTVAALEDSLVEGLAAIPAIAREESHGDPAVEDLLARYLGATLRYRLGPAELAGLGAFFSFLAEDGDLPSPAPPLRFFDAGI